EITAPAMSDISMRAKAGRRRRIAEQLRDPGSDIIVQVGEPDCRARDFQHVELAEGEERVLYVVGGKVHRNAGCAQLVSQRQTSHPWCAMGAPILKVEIGVGQRNDVNTGVSHLGNERCGLILVAQRQRATVARNNATFEASAQNALCDQLKRSEEHTSELQSRENLVCRLLLEKK